MGVIGPVLTAIAQAIRRVVWMIVDGVMKPVARTVDAVAGGVLSGLIQAFRRDPIETEEILDDGAKEGADMEAVSALERARVRSLTPGQRVLEACALRSKGQRYGHLFDRGIPEHQDLERWVRRLSEANAARVMRIHSTSLDRHLDPSTPCSLDLPIPEAIRARSELVRADREAAERTRAANPAREAALKIREEAKRKGRRPRVADVVPAVSF